MKPFLNITLQFDEKAIGAKISDLANDEITMKQIHTAFAKIIDPFVPMRQGILASSATPTKDYVEYAGPYAHYQYMGEVYGPNYPGLEKGGTPGWRSPSGKGSKHPTGREIGKEGSATLFPVWKIEDGQYVKPTADDGMIEWEFGYTKQHHPNASHHWDKKAMETELPKFEKAVENILRRRAKEMYG